MVQVPVRDRNGEPNGVYTFNGTAANRALELIGKHLGMFVERQEIKVDVGWRFTIGKGYETAEATIIDAISDGHSGDYKQNIPLQDSESEGSESDAEV